MCSINNLDEIQKNAFKYKYMYSICNYYRSVTGKQFRKEFLKVVINFV